MLMLMSFMQRRLDSLDRDEKRLEELKQALFPLDKSGEQKRHHVETLRLVNDNSRSLHHGSGLLGKNRNLMLRKAEDHPNWTAEETQSDVPNKVAGEWIL